jgi:uncharacterized protein YaeQ
VTMHTFDIELSDLRRSVYETLSFTVARHPSESLAYLVTRVLAYCLEFEEGIVLSKAGLSDADEPALSVFDLTGRRTAWIEVGLPSVDRLHRAAKATERVAVWPQRDPSGWLRQLEGERIHRSAEIGVHAIDPALIEAVGARLDRRTKFAITASDGELYVAMGAESLGGALVSHPLG